MTSKQDDPCGPGKFIAPTRSINIRTMIPGPKSRALLEHYQANAGTGADIVIASAHGARVIDVDNNVYIDFASGTAVGHTHERVVAAMQRQAETADVLPGSTIHTAEIELCELLNRLAPRLSDQPVTRLLPRELLIQLMPNFSPVMSLADGFSVNRERDDAVAIELGIGFGRTGKLFATEYLAVQPAAIVVELTKHVAAIIGTQQFLDNFAIRSQVSPVDAVAALETIHIVVEQKLEGRAVQVGDIVAETIRRWLPALANVQMIKGIGSTYALRLDSAAAGTVITEARRNGLLLGEGVERGVIPLRYALMIPEEQLYEGLDVLEFVLKKVT